ncbi:MAG: DUF1549 domain-containing protein, partial [Planctomycetaceae bacterium]|nr:DUF1549 domain-containing protein [Planctomycetaceae bacterium]
MRGRSAFLLLLFASVVSVHADERIDFASQIKPLLSDRCYACHGPDAANRAAELRLDLPDEARKPLASDGAAHAIVPGAPDQSVLLQRVFADDPDLVMPPPDSRLSLTANEKELLKRWIEQGAEWQLHWAFVAPQKAALPSVKLPNWCRNEIDHFVLSRMETAGLSPAAPTDRARLLRRATFDLTGLPPTITELDSFLADDSPQAFEKVVDRLLAAPQFGERMAADWMDVSRYSDTYGYQVDRDRFVWPWRDWVIDAFNRNLPADQFIIQQLAGDLLPDADRNMILATTFNRLHPQKVEGGSVPEEFRNEYVCDRIQTVGTAFLGLTLECCKCHDHKYDPISQREFYQLYSWFNNIDEAGLYSFFTNSVPTPTLQLTTPEEERSLQAAQQEINRTEQQLAAQMDLLRQQDLQQLLAEANPVLPAPNNPESETALIPGQVAALSFEDGSFGANRIVDGRDGHAVELTGDHEIDVKAGNFSRWQPFTVSLWTKIPHHFERAVVFHRSRAWTDAGSRGYELLIEDGCLSAALIHFWPGNAIRVRSVQPVTTEEWVHITVTWDGSLHAAGLQLWLNGRPLETEVVRDNLYKEITGGGGDTIQIGARFRDHGYSGGLVDDFQVYDRQLTSLEIRQLFDGRSLLDAVKQVTAADAGAVEKVSAEERRELIAWLLATRSEKVRQGQAELKDRREKLASLQNATQEIMVMREMPQPRETHVLLRGAYDKPGDPVTANVPAVFPPLASDQPRNRLGLALWLTSRENPLTARVTVNRLWQQCFGNGIVRTPEDFGSQGAAPTHPQLLDWLAVDFQEHGWDVKRLLKMMMMSAAYQQKATASPQADKSDPENLWLSHATVYRLSAEMIRDNALAV